MPWKPELPFGRNGLPPPPGAVGLGNLMLGKPPEGSGDRISPCGRVLVPGAVPYVAPLLGNSDEGIDFEFPWGGVGCFPAGRPVPGP